MSTEKDYIDSLQNFSKSVHLFVEEIKKQASTDKDFKDLVSSTKEQSANILENAKKLNVISEDVSETKSNTEKVLSIVKSLSKKKDSGVMDTLNSKDKAKNVRSSVKTIALMAGGILAIGTAFKLIGEVDFKSVMALSVALPAVSYAFNKVGEQSSDPKETSLTALSMIVMAGGLLGAGQLLGMMPNIGLGSLFTSVGVAASMALALYGMSKAVDVLGDGEVSKLYLMAPLLPVMAGSIVGSGQILQSMPTLTLAQVLSTVGVGIALASSLIPMSIAARAVGGNAKDVTLLSLLLPVMSAGINVSGLILQDMPDLDSGRILKGSLTIAGSTLALSGAIWGLNKLGLGIKEAVVGTLATTIMSGGLMAMSHILSVGNYSNYPSVDWATGVGLSMLGYLPSVLITGAIAATGFGALVIGAGILSMTAIAGGLATVSHIIKKGNYTGGPSVEWAEGVGLSLMGFVDPILKLNPSLLGMLLGDTLSAKIDSIEKIGEGLNKTSHKIAGGNYTGGPSVEWATGVGLSLMSFAATMENIEPGLLDKLIFGTSLQDKLDSMVTVAGVLPRIGQAVGRDTSMYSGGPKPEWAEGSAKSILSFASALDTVDTGWFSSNLDGQLQGMIKIAGVLPELGKAVTSDTSMYEGGPKKEWAEAISTTLNAFIGALDVDDAWFGSNLDERLLDMIKIAKVLPELGKAVTNDTSIYSGGPDETWTKNVGATVTTFSNSISQLSENMTPSELSDMLLPMLNIGRIIRGYALLFNGVKFDNYPSIDWSKGMASFVSNFTSIKGINNTKTASIEILKLSRAYRNLTNSLSGISDVMNDMPDTMPDVSGLYAGLVTLSLIDDSKLKNVFEAIDSHKGRLSDTMSAIIKASNIQEKNNTTDWGGFGGILDFNNIGSSKSQQTTISPNIRSSSTVNPTDNIDKKEKLDITLDTTSLENKVQELSTLLNSVISTLGIIADNTTKEETNKLLDY